MEAIPGNLIVIKLKNRLKPITQYQLEEFLLLTRQLKETEERWNDIRLILADALRMGAEVEPGVHEAHIEQKLVVR